MMSTKITIRMMMMMNDDDVNKGNYMTKTMMMMSIPASDSRRRRIHSRSIAGCSAQNTANIYYIIILQIFY